MTAKPATPPTTPPTTTGVDGLDPELEPVSLPAADVADAPAGATAVPPPITPATAVDDVEVDEAEKEVVDGMREEKDVVEPDELELEVE